MSKKKNNMYAGAKTWNPFKGCEFGCSYCVPTFQRQAKRQKPNAEGTKGCQDCYDYKPHIHAKRLHGLPSTEIVFVCGNGDIKFCPPDFVKKIIARIVKNNEKRPEQTFYFQSKEPACLEQYLDLFPDNVILVTTLETNRAQGYEFVSKAPVPLIRWSQFLELDWPRKVVTIEPVMDFDVEEFTDWIIDVDPEYVWLGFNSRPQDVELPEPSMDKMEDFIAGLKAEGIKIRGKTLRGITL